MLPTASVSRSTDGRVDPESPSYRLIELFFLAYRGFVGDADRILAEYGFGRAHHRVLHFVDRRPGLTITDLLDVLGITKQSLGRVLKELVDTGYVEQRTGQADRRHRLLYPTPAGAALALRLARVQTRRIERALADAGGPALEEPAGRFLLGMVEPRERAGLGAAFAAEAPG